LADPGFKCRKALSGKDKKISCFSDHQNPLSPAGIAPFPIHMINANHKKDSWYNKGQFSGWKEIEGKFTARSTGNQGV
jgi:hypothetical protein